MRLFLENINILNPEIEKIINNKYNKSNNIKETFIYSTDGIYKYKNNYLQKCRYIDKEIIKGDKVLIDNSIIDYDEICYQIPIYHVIVNIDKDIYNMSNNINIIILKEDNFVKDIYIESKLEYDLIKEEISSFITLIN